MVVVKVVKGRRKEVKKEVLVQARKMAPLLPFFFFWKMTKSGSVGCPR